MVSRDDVAKNVISSTSYSNLQRDIGNLEENLARVRTKHLENLNDVEGQESSIKLSIKDMRRKLDEHLNNLEKDVLQELTTKAEICKTDLFPAVGEEEKLVLGEHIWLQESLSHMKMNEFFIDLNTDPVSQMLTFKSLGSITVASKTIVAEIVAPSVKAAQIPREPTIDIEKVKLREKTKMSYQSENQNLSFGCLICSSGDLIIASSIGQLEILNENGQHKINVSLSSIPSDITEISNDNIGITFGNEKKK
ncbi:unnamed protein product [Mytilus coruscus]|uniref:Uncharacterized protein n=1 Tax=Mytilus coruscus TaxID=42192 RepID=A0A6J8B8T0_MYTCO|nr:unnamed protein product [Mytilus coruscus]